MNSALFAVTADTTRGLGVVRAAGAGPAAVPVASLPLAFALRFAAVLNGAAAEISTRCALDPLEADTSADIWACPVCSGVNLAPWLHLGGRRLPVPLPADLEAAYSADPAVLAFEGHSSVPGGGCCGCCGLELVPDDSPYLAEVYTHIERA